MMCSVAVPMMSHVAFALPLDVLDVVELILTQISASAPMEAVMIAIGCPGARPPIFVYLHLHDHLYLWRNNEMLSLVPGTIFLNHGEFFACCVRRASTT